jgi:hypothetical protein
MDKTLFDTVLGIATDVRYWAEGRAEGDDIPDLTLRGYCAIASAELFRQLKAAGLDSEIHVWECPETADSHAFIVVEDHVVDVTATHVREAEVHQYWNSSYSFKSVEALIKRQKKDRWPREQIAYSA